MNLSLCLNVRHRPSGGCLGLLLALLCLSLGASAITPVAPSGAIAAPGQLLAPSQFLKEKAGFTPWRVLARVELTKQSGKLRPSFAAEVNALNTKPVKVEGFMIPLDIGDKQKRFLLVAAPPHCSFCLPAGPDAMIEIRAKTNVRYGFEAVSLSGTLQVLSDDPAGLYYRLVDAVRIE
ncbi:MAG: DUF3299 domain-containing protein [Betaproteobacteria bacterium]|nr:MAG: DUF3299 domain-containing protein [Betaproteobacteria bacterium]TAG46001.1 MAG: DUF3299 domain-containing protein [Betaproteobacteria bacterium]